MKRRLEKRLAYLYSGELFSIITFVPVGFIVNHQFPNLHLYELYSFWISFLLLEFLLLQGTVYWYVKLKRLRKENNPLASLKVIRQLHGLKKVNVIMIFTAMVAFAIDFIKWYPSLPLGGLLLTFFIYGFAILEFINYYYIQLSYDNVSDIKKLIRSRKLKISSMNKEFKRMKKGAVQKAPI